MILLNAAEIEAIPVTNFGGNEDDLNIARAQVEKIAKWLEDLPTDGHDKYFFYHKELAQQLRRLL